MNADRLLAHYEKIADAPDAITKVRRFILDLAVRGKLVPQDANDEPVSELLKRIGKEKARLATFASLAILIAATTSTNHSPSRQRGGGRGLMQSAQSLAAAPRPQPTPTTSPNLARACRGLRQPILADTETSTSRAARSIFRQKDRELHRQP